MGEELPPTFMDSARQRLASQWEIVLGLPTDAVLDPSIPPQIADAIVRSVNSTMKTYRYVLPTQLLAKAVDDDLDARCVQVRSGLIGSFDARSLCHQVIVDFDRTNSNVLGGSSSPYLNNPLRIPAILPEHRPSQKDKRGFDDLVAVLDYVQANPAMTEGLLRAVLLAVRGRLSEVVVVYPIPNRISLEQTNSLLRKYLLESSGGLRLQAIAVALFKCIGARFGLFGEVRSNDINAADASTGCAADLECVDGAGNIVMAVEVKDRELTLHDIQDKLPAMREKGIRELPFLVSRGVVEHEAQQASDLINKQFVTGQNIYVLEFESFLQSCLVLFGEGGRRGLLRELGDTLDECKADIVHRRKWADLLADV